MFHKAAWTSWSLLLAVTALALAAAAVLRDRGAVVRAAGAGEARPVMTVVDERESGGRTAEATIYVVWPGEKKVEAYNSGQLSYVTYDFVRKTVTMHDAEIE
jgi:hypothetical protein